MSDYLFDSSALVKRYIRETGTSWIRNLTAANRGNAIFIAQITQIEVVSALMRLARNGRFSLQTAQSIRKLLERHVEREYPVVGLTESVAERAKDLLEAYSLRAYDAV